MKERIKNMSDKDLVRKIADDMGYFHAPRFYRDEALSRYKRKISSPTVVKAIGSQISRVRNDWGAALEKAKALIELCQYDRGFTDLVVRRAFKL